jgi:hypothetical protein
LGHQTLVLVGMVEPLMLPLFISRIPLQRLLVSKL